MGLVGLARCSSAILLCLGLGCLQLPAFDQRLGLILLLVWTMTSMVANWEYHKVTWLIFGIIATLVGSRVRLGMTLRRAPAQLDERGLAYGASSSCGRANRLNIDLLTARETPALRVALLAGCLERHGAEKQAVFMARALRQAGVDVRVYSLTRGDHYEHVLRSEGFDSRWAGRLRNPLLRVLRRWFAECGASSRISCRRPWVTTICTRRWPPGARTRQPRRAAHRPRSLPQDAGFLDALSVPLSDRHPRQLETCRGATARQRVDGA